MGERVIDDALTAGLSPAEIHALVIEPAMVRIGDLWESGVITVADEHLATAISQGALVRLFGALSVGRASSRERVLIAAVEGQHHVLGLRMCADLLLGAGFEVFFLGANVPVDALSAFVSARQPAVIGLGFGIGHDLSRLAESILAVHDASRELRLMLGGPGVPEELRHTGFPFVPSSLEVLPTVERLLSEPPQALPDSLSSLLAALAEPAWPPSLPGEPDAVVERLVEMVAQSADVARDYITRARVLTDLALRDAVTDMPNRRAFDDRIALQAPTGEAAAFLIVDVDDFKAVNDGHGHDAGDRLLRRVGASIGDAIRARDFVARMGGDEFGVLLPGAGLAVAREVGERIRAAVAALDDPPVTVSVGVAPLEGDTRAALLAADRALYRAKTGGRDRVASTSTTVRRRPRRP
jgi:diguanylate cyclase (GGDEF)-like protein